MCTRLLRRREKNARYCAPPPPSSSSSFVIIIQMSANFPPSICVVYFPLSTTLLKCKLHNVWNRIVLYSRGSNLPLQPHVSRQLEHNIAIQEKYYDILWGFYFILYLYSIRWYYIMCSITENIVFLRKLTLTFIFIFIFLFYPKQLIYYIE